MKSFKSANLLSCFKPSQPAVPGEPPRVTGKGKATAGATNNPVPAARDSGVINPPPAPPLPPSDWKNQANAKRIRSLLQPSSTGAGGADGTADQSRKGANFDKKRHVREMTEQLLSLAKDGVVTKKQLEDTLGFSRASAHQDIDTYFDAALKSGHDPLAAQPAKLEILREAAKTRIDGALAQAFAQQGWSFHQPATSNIQWEPGKGPFLVKKGVSTQQLTLSKADIAEGTYGSVSVFSNENGDNFIGKISKNKMSDGHGNVVDDLSDELDAYKTIYEKVGAHPNLVNVYGIAMVPKGGELKRTMLMDAVPGPSGTKAFEALKNSWQSGKISSAEYWSAMQFIGRRMFDVTAHLGKAGVVHNDIKPDNFMINQKTGEPVLIDLGLWTAQGAKSRGGTLDFMAPEARRRQPVDVRSDVVSVAASLLDGVVGDTNFAPNNGLQDYKNLPRDQDGNISQPLGSYYDVKSAYTDFMSKTLEPDQNARVGPGTAQRLNFLNDSMLDDDAAKAVITKSLGYADVEAGKPQGERWQMAAVPTVSPEMHAQIQFAINDVTRHPDLPRFANLVRQGKIDPWFNAYRAQLGGLGLVASAVEQDAQRHARNLIFMTAPWFAQVDRVVSRFPDTIIKSGVDKNGVLIKNAPVSSSIKERKELEKLNEMTSATVEVAPHVTVAQLQDFTVRAEAFLLDVTTMPLIADPQLEDDIKHVKQRVQTARKLIEMDGIVRQAEEVQASPVSPQLTVKELAAFFDKSSKNSVP